MMETWAPIALDVASWAAFTAGGFFLLVGSIGLIRLPDFWARLHGAGMIDTLGVELMLLGLIFQAGLTQATIKLLLIGVFIFFTSPTATHAVANAAFVAGVRPTKLKRDDTQDPNACEPRDKESPQ